VPEFNPGFPALPAQIDRPTLALTWEINQSLFEVFDFATKIRDFFEDLLGFSTPGLEIFLELAKLGCQVFAI